MSTTRTRGTRLWFAAAWVAVLTLAAWLRLAGLNEQGLQHWDEGAHTAGPLQIGPYERDTIVPFYAPPLFPGLVGLTFRLFGVSDTVAILTAGLFGWLSIAAVGLFAARLFGATAGLLTAFFVATAEYHIAYCRIALTDAPYLLCFVLALYLFHCAIARSRGVLFVLAGFVSGLALLLKYHGFLPFAMAGLYMLIAALATWWRQGGRAGISALGKVVRASFWAALGFAGPAIFLVFYIDTTVGLERYAENRSQWMPGVAGWAFKASALYMARAFSEWLPPALLALGALGVIAALRRPTKAIGYLACWLIPFALAVPFYKNYPRLLLPLVPGIAILASLGTLAIARFFPGRARQIATAAIIAILVSAQGTWMALDTLRVHPTGYREAGRFVTERMRDGMTALLLTQHTIFFYVRDARGLFLSHNEKAGKQCLREEAFDLLAVDLRLEHHPEFRAYLESPEGQRLELLATIPNPLYEMTIVNSGGFALLDALRANATSPKALAASTIRIYAKRRAGG
ncbi:MAG: glycosyltransferase family 39 protein [Planctomycetota bacterium]